MSSVICTPDECQQTLLYERNGDTLTPFIRMICVDANGNVSTVKDFNLDGSDRVVTGEVITNPGDGASCCHSVTLYDHVAGCTSIPFIRQYQQGEGGSFTTTDYDLNGQSYFPSGTITNEPPAQTTSKEKMCDASSGETFYRWFVSCGNEVVDSHDTDLNGVDYTASDAVYSGDCVCKPLTLRRKLCDTVGTNDPVEFYRTSKYNGSGDETSTVDTTLDGNSYTVQGTVGICKPDTPDTFTSQKNLCDRIGQIIDAPLNTIPAHTSPFSIPLSNGVNVSFEKGGWGFYYFHVAGTADSNTMTFSEPVDVEFGLSSLLYGEHLATIGGNVEPDWIDDRVAEWDAVSRVVQFRPYNHTEISFPPATRGAPSIPMPANLIFKGTNVTSVTFSALIPISLNAAAVGITYLKVNNISYVPFVRTTTYNGSGQLISTVDTTPVGDPYTVQGVVTEGQCPP